MYYIHSQQKSLSGSETIYGVLDTVDNKLEFYPFEVISEFVSMGIKICNYDNIVKRDKSNLTKLKLLCADDDMRFIWSDFRGIICVYSGNKEEVKIPNGVNYLQGVSNSVRKIYLPDSLECIAYDCFMGSDNLEYVRFPNKPFRIENKAFSGSSIKSIDLSNCYSLGDKAFAECSELKVIESLGNIDNIPNNAFKGCIRLANVNLSSRVKVLAQNCFYNTVIKEVYIPPSVRVFNPLAFGVGVKIHLYKTTRLESSLINTDNIVWHDLR